MPSQVRPATLADVPSICDTYMSAFSEDAGSLQVFPRESGTGYKFWHDTLTEGLGAVNAHLLVVSDPSTAGTDRADTIIAFAKWVFLEAGSAANNAAAPQPADIWPLDGNPELAANFTRALAEGHRKEMGGRPHWYLEIIAVHRSWMGKGVSTALLRWGLDRADRDGTPCYLESSEVAKPIYEKNGFQIVNQLGIDTPRGRIVQYFMLREEPKKQ